MAIYLTGGSRIEDAKRLSAQFSEKSQGYRLCSPDTILKTLSDKTEEDTFVQSGEGNRYKFSLNAGLSGLLLDGMLECGQMDVAVKHTFDYDNQFIPTEKYDSKYSYKKPSGTSPASPRWTGFRSTSRGATATPTSSSGRPTRCDAPSRVQAPVERVEGIVV